MKTSTLYRAVPALAIAIALAVAACGGGESESSDGASSGGGSSGDSAAGEETYSGTCASCHGPDAKGLPNLGKDLTTSALVKDSTDDELVAFIVKGRSADDPENTSGVAMPPKGGNPALSEEDLAGVVAYLRTLEE
jgi:disulfide bond formation protein DsbB